MRRGRGGLGPQRLREGGRPNGHFVLALVGTISLLDQLSKGWALAHFTAIPRVIEITSFFNVLLTWNNGISFGLFNSTNTNYSYLFFILSSIIIIILILLSMYIELRILRLGIYIIIGGAIGNNIDRLRHHGVVDFIDLHILSLHWPAFNFADLAITIGAVVLMSDFLPPRFWASLRG